MMELYLNDELVDLFGDEAVAVDYAVNEIGDIQSRSGDGSYQFSLPMTNRNKMIFENSQVVISATIIPYRRLTARLQVDGVVQLLGFAILAEVTDIFDINVYGGNADWFKSIGDKSIQALNLDHLDHYFEPVTIRDYRANNTDWEDAINYPNVDYGLFATAPTVYWYNFYPGVYYKYLVYKIMLEAGFNIDGDFWDNDTLFPTQFNPFCGLFKRDRDYSKRNSGSWDTPSSVFNMGTLVYDIVPTNTISSTAYNILNPFNADNRLVILDNCALTLRVRATVTNVDILPQAFSLSVDYVDAGGTTQTYDIVLDTIAAGATENYDETFTLNMSRCELILYWLMQLNLPSSFSDLQIDVLDYVVDENEEDYLYIDPIFNYVTVASTLPDVKQKDVMVTMFNQYCLLCSTNFQTDRIRLFTFKKVNQNIPIAKDWSNKLDLSKKPAITFLSENYAQSNLFTYAKDDIDTYLLEDPDYCEGTLTIDNENLETEKIVFESVFAPIKRQNDTSGGTIRMAWIPKFINGEDNEVTPRVGTIAFESIHLITMDGYATESIQPAIHGQPLSFGDALLPVYYPELSDLLNYAKFVKCLLKLNVADINALDFSIPVYIEYFQAHFYINLISQYRVNSVQSTLVELVKLQ